MATPRRGETILGTHAADFLSKQSNAEVLTIGSYNSNSSHIRFYVDNNVDKTVLFGYSNNGAKLWDPNNVPTKLELDGTLLTSNLRSVRGDNVIDVTGTSFYGFSNISITGTILNAVGNPLKLGGGGVTDFEIIQADVATLDPDLASMINPSNVGTSKAYVLPIGATGVEPDPFNQKYIYTLGPSDFEYSVEAFNLDGSSNIHLLKHTSPGVRETVFIWENDIWRYVTRETEQAAVQDYPIINGSLLMESSNLADHVVFQPRLATGGRYLLSANVPFTSILSGGEAAIETVTLAPLIVGLYSGSVPSSSNDFLQTAPLYLSSKSLSFSFYVDTTGFNTQNMSIAIFEDTGSGMPLVSPMLMLDSAAQLHVINLVTSRGLGNRDSIIVRRSLQCNPLKLIETISQEDSPKSTFSMSVEGNFTSSPDRVDVFVNGNKLIYLNPAEKDYDIDVNYNAITNETTFTLTIEPGIQVSNIVDITIWPTAPVSDYYSSGYLYQNINTLYTSTPWLNVDASLTNGIRTAGDVIIDGDVYVRGQVFTDCNTSIFPSGIAYDSALEYITSNAFGTLNLVDGAVTPQKMKIDGNLVPFASDLYDLGSNGVDPRRWRNFHASNVYTENIAFTGEIYRNGEVYVSSKWTQIGSDVFRTSGGVGIGTTSLNGYSLNVTGGLKASTLDGVGSNITNLNAVNMTGTIAVQNGGTGLNTLSANKLLVGNGTNGILQPSLLHWSGTQLGIGKSNPSSTLDVAGSITGTSFSGVGTNLTSLTAGNINGILTVTQGGTGANTLTANKLLVGSGASAISAPTNLHWSGTQLGIGTATPAHELDVVGTVRATTFSGSGASLTALPASQLSGQVSVANGGTGTNTLTANKLLVGGGASAISAPTNLHWSGTQLGIGTATPTQALDVVGTIKATTFSGSGASLTALPTSQLSGQVSIANGGTGTNALTANKLLVGGASAISAPTDLHWDSANNRLGIVTASPLSTLTVNGNVAIGTSIAAPTNGLHVNGEIRSTGDITGFYSSDRRLKENIEPLSDPLNIVNALRGVRFDWTADYIATHGGEDGYFVRKHDIGVIAQEVESVLPELVAVRDDGYKAVKYDKMVALLIEAVKELSKKVEILKQQKN